MSAQDKARNVAPRDGARAFWSYLGVTTTVGLSVAGFELSHIHQHDFTMMGGALIVVAAMIMIGEVRPLVIAGVSDPTGVTISTAFLFALLLHMGLPVTLFMMALATVIGDMCYRRAIWRTGFNVAQFSLSYVAADLALLCFGDSASDMHMRNVSGHDLPAIAVAAIAYFVVNKLFVAAAICLRNHTSLRREFLADMGFEALSTGALLAIAPIIVVVINRGPALVPLMLFPLAAVYATAAMTRDRELQSLSDPLTGLPNRKLLVQSTRSAIEAAAADGSYVALYLLDLDRFKEINDTLGHHVGDALLQVVGQRLKSVLRPQDVIARLGGDEFAVLVTEVAEPQASLDMAERLKSVFDQPFRHDGLTHEIDGSIGVAVYPDHGGDFETLLQRADVAMYVAKELGTGTQAYSPEIDRHSTSRLSMLADLRNALDRCELSLHYQPKADLHSGDIVGVEALLRWQHPARGNVPPAEFLPLAEQTGLMRVITQFVLDEALGQLSTWWQEDLRVQVAVNVCARDLYDRNFADLLARSMARYDLPPRALMIEVTESVLMTDPARAAATLLSLADLGVGVSLDDFGTGYSSLVHLKRLPVTEIKIDQSFVMRMQVNEDDAAIVQSIIDLAAALGLRTVAEGVETREEWDQLSAYGCDVAQGWYLAKAMPARVATAWLQDYRRGSSQRRGERDPRPRLTVVDRSMLG